MGYFLRCQMGKLDIPLGVNNLRELTISQDMNHFLPEFRMKVIDATGQLTHTIPFDSNMNKVSFTFSQGLENEKDNRMEFDVYMCEPVSNQATPAAMYDISGLLHIGDAFTTDYSRSFKGPMNTSLQTVAEELGTDLVDISPSLAEEKNLVQPFWNNGQFLKYHKDRLIGSNGEWGFKCFVKCATGRSTLVFKSLKEMIGNNIAYKFILSDRAYEDQYPIFNYSIYDNYKVYTTFAGNRQDYVYFDYETEEYIEGVSLAADYMSLSKFFLLEANMSNGSNYLNKLGRTSEFTSDFDGYVQNNYGNRLMDLVKMWITTQGLTNITPGTVVQVMFPFGIAGDALLTYQYSGYWLVEKVVHNMGDHFLTKLLLTRNGIDTDKTSTLLPATTQKRA